MNTLVFDIETIPDVAGGRKIYDLPDDLDDDGVAKAMFHLRYQKAGTEFLPHHLHCVAAISVTFRGRGDDFKVWSLGDESASAVERPSRPSGPGLPPPATTAAGTPAGMPPPASEGSALEPTEEPGGGGMKWVVIGGVLLLAAGGAAAWFLNLIPH